MRLKDPFSLKAADMTKRTNKPRKPRDEESSDEVSGKFMNRHRALNCKVAFVGFKSDVDGWNHNSGFL